MSEFAIGAYVRKKSGAFWEGTVVGHYSTRQTVDGVAVQLFGWEDGPVQIYPASALEPCDPAEGRLAPQLLTINLSEDELAELQAAARNSAPGKITVATPPPESHVVPPSVDDIAEVLFSQRGTPYSWERAIDADPLSDEGTLVSIVRDDARAVLALFGSPAPQTREVGE